MTDRQPTLTSNFLCVKFNIISDDDRVNGFKGAGWAWEIYL